MVHPELGQGSGTVRSLPRPRSPIRIDWASFHSNSRASSEESRHQDRDVYKTPPPKHAELAQPIGNDHISVVEPIVETAWMSSRIYDIPTLLKYRGSLAGIGVIAKIKPDALRGRRLTLSLLMCYVRLLTLDRELVPIRICSSPSEGSHPHSYAFRNLQSIKANSGASPI